MTKFVNTENAILVEITSIWSSDIRRSYKLVKSRKSRSVHFNCSSGDAVNYPSHWVQGEALVEVQKMINYKTAYFNADCVDLFK